MTPGSTHPQNIPHQRRKEQATKKGEVRFKTQFTNAIRRYNRDHFCRQWKKNSCPAAHRQQAPISTHLWSVEGQVLSAAVNCQFIRAYAHGVSRAHHSWDIFNRVGVEQDRSCKCNVNGHSQAKGDECGKRQHVVVVVFAGLQRNRRKATGGSIPWKKVGDSPELKALVS